MYLISTLIFFLINFDCYDCLSSDYDYYDTSATKEAAQAIESFFSGGSCLRIIVASK